MYKKLLWIAALAFSFILSQSALADSSMCGENLKRIISTLKLDEAQKEKIKPVLEQLKTSIKDSASKMKDLRAQINQQEMSTNMDPNAVNGLVDQKTKLIGDMMKAKIKAKNQIYNILNDQQKTELQSMWKKAEEKMAEKYKNCHEE